HTRLDNDDASRVKGTVERAHFVDRRGFGRVGSIRCEREPAWISEHVRVAVTCTGRYLERDGCRWLCRTGSTPCRLTQGCGRKRSHHEHLAPGQHLFLLPRNLVPILVQRPACAAETRRPAPAMIAPGALSTCRERIPDRAASWEGRLRRH